MSSKIVEDHIDAKEKINFALGKLAVLYEQDCAEYEYPWIVFSIANKEYFISARYVLRVDAVGEVTPYPHGPAHCPGVVWDDEGLISLLDVRSMLGADDGALKNEKGLIGLPMIVVIEPNGERRGMIVDKVVSLEFFRALTEHPTESLTESGNAQETVKYCLSNAFYPVIHPKNFGVLLFEDKGKNRYPN